MPSKKTKPASRKKNGETAKPTRSRTRVKTENHSNDPNTENALMKRLNRKSAAKSRRAASKYKGMTVNGIIIHKAKEESNRIRRVQNNTVQRRDVMIKRLLDRARKDKEKREKMKKKTVKTKTLPLKQNAAFREEYEKEQQNNLDREHVKYSDNRHMSR